MAPNGIFRGSEETDSRVGLPLKYHMIVITSPAIFDAVFAGNNCISVMKSILLRLFTERNVVNRTKEQK